MYFSIPYSAAAGAKAERSTTHPSKPGKLLFQLWEFPPILPGTAPRSGNPSKAKVLLRAPETRARSRMFRSGREDSTSPHLLIFMKPHQ